MTQCLHDVSPAKHLSLLISFGVRHNRWQEVDRNCVAGVAAAIEERTWWKKPPMWVGGSKACLDFSPSPGAVLRGLDTTFRTCKRRCPLLAAFIRAAQALTFQTIAFSAS